MEGLKGYNSTSTDLGISHSNEQGTTFLHLTSKKRPTKRLWTCDHLSSHAKNKSRHAWNIVQLKASCNILTTTTTVDHVCAFGDLHRVHDSTQAQRADRSTRVLQRSSTPCQHSSSALRKVKTSISETRTTSSTPFPTPFQRHTPGTSLLRENTHAWVPRHPVRKGSSGTDKSPRSANIAHIQLGAAVCAWWCLFRTSINVMARLALTHRTGRCSKLFALFHNATSDRATRSQRSMDTQVITINSLNSLSRPQSKTDCGLADGWQPRSPTTASGRGNQPAGGNLESNPGCPGPRDIKRDGHNWLGTSVKPALSISDRAKVQSQPRSSPRWCNGRSRAQWKTFKKWCGRGTSIS